jgi:hypothetical protein
LTSNVEGRITWLELLSAINQILPVDKDDIAGKKADEIAQQNRIFISSIDAFTVDDISAWFATVKDRYIPDDEELAEALGSNANNEPAQNEPTNTTENNNTTTPATPTTTQKIPTSMSERLSLVKGPPSVTGKIVQISGYHYHNPESATRNPNERMGADYLRYAFIRKLKFGRVSLPPTLEKQYSGTDKKNTERVLVTMRELGIHNPTLLQIPKVVQTEIINPRVLLQLYIEERSKDPIRGRGGNLGGGGFGGGGGLSGGRDTMNRTGNIKARNNFEDAISNPFVSGNTVDAKTEEYISEKAKEMQTKDKIVLGRFDFVIQFAWVETPPKAREDAKTKK